MFRHSLLLTAFILFFSGTGTLFAADQIILLPASTKEIKQETRSVAGAVFECAYYESDLDAGQVRNFYRRFLAAAGWKEKDYLGDLKKNAADFRPDPAMLKLVENNLMFERDGAIINIVFTPAAVSADKKTDFTIMQGKLDLMAGGDAGADFTPRLLDSPQKDPAPVYPGAALVSLTEGEEFLKAAYTVNEDIEAVGSFYRIEMTGYGWILAEDDPVIKVNGGSKEDIEKYCPDCVKKGFSFEPSDIIFKDFVFTNAQGDKCAVGLMQLTLPMPGQAKKMIVTSIMVDYEKK